MVEVEDNLSSRVKVEVEAVVVTGIKGVDVITKGMMVIETNLEQTKVVEAEVSPHHMTRGLILLANASMRREAMIGLLKVTETITSRAIVALISKE